MRSKIVARGRITREIGKKRGYKAALFLEEAITSLMPRLGFFIVGVVSVKLRNYSI